MEHSCENPMACVACLTAMVDGTLSPGRYQAIKQTWADYQRDLKESERMQREYAEQKERTRAQREAANGPVLAAIRKVLPEYGTVTYTEDGNDYKVREFLRGESTSLTLSTTDLAALLGVELPMKED